MSDLRSQFEAAAEEVQQLPKRPSNANLLQIYALYKQATVGDVVGNRPGMADFVNRSKYDAWAKLQGISQEKAMQDYVDLVEQLKASGGR
jgi:acyl-CoA-binding protein